MENPNLNPNAELAATPPAVHRRPRRPAVLGLSLCLSVAAGAMWYLNANGADGLRNADYPQTYIKTIEVDLASPNHWVRLTWIGPHADSQETGPFPSTPGAGIGDNDCNDEVESNRGGSNCTPKGARYVEGFNKTMPSAPQYQFVTWIDKSRAIGFHSFPRLADHPSSQGCVRMEAHAAQLIHDNSIARKTEIIIGGTWNRPDNKRIAAQ
jgi:hypothetical protein